MHSRWVTDTMHPLGQARQAVMEGGCYIMNRTSKHKTTKKKTFRNTQDLPCMHLDPGVNRLRFNITSIHQTDSWPVAPDIVFPICVILQRWERV